MQITSLAFQDGQPMPTKYGGRHENISPTLSITDVPMATVSLVLVVHDTDAPGGDFTHWIVWNIPANLRMIEEGRVPVGAIQGTNDSGKIGYFGPTPPSGIHHYHFVVYALDITLNLPSGSDRKTLEQKVLGHVLDFGELIGVYSA